jgi:hypothetical protein
MHGFLKSKAGVLCLCGFALLMAFMFIRVLANRTTPNETTGKTAPAARPANKQALKAASAQKEESSMPGSSPGGPDQQRGDGAVVPKTKTSEKKAAPDPLSENLAYLDRVKEPARRSRSEKDREGLTVTRRKTASSAQFHRGADRDEDEPVLLFGALRLSGRPPAKDDLPNAGEANASAPDKQPVTAPALAAAPKIQPEQKAFVPYGFPIKCELVFTIDSTMEETPIVGLVIEPVFNNGLLVIPAGSELHGLARPDRLRDRIYSSKEWVLVLPREGPLQNGRQLSIKGLALDRYEPDTNGLTWGITDGSNGLRGSVIRTMESEEIKRFAASFISVAAVTLEEREGGSRNSNRISNTPANAALQGVSSLLGDLSKEITAEIERNGMFLRVPSGKQFYFYPQQSILPEKAILP